MRIRRRSVAPGGASTSDLVKMWAGLGVLLVLIALAVGRMNDCVATDVRDHPFYANTPGLNSDDLPASVREQLLVTLNNRYCTCGCLMTLASCRNNHMSCRTSKRIGQELIDSAHRKF